MWSRKGEHLNGSAGTFYADASDIGELVSCRIRDNAAVTEYEDTIVAVLRSIGKKNESTGYSLVAFTGSNNL